MAASGASGKIPGYGLIDAWPEGIMMVYLVIALKAPAVSRFLSLRYAGAFFSCLVLVRALWRLVGQDWPWRVDDSGNIAEKRRTEIDPERRAEFDLRGRF